MLILRTVGTLALIALTAHAQIKPTNVDTRILRAAGTANDTLAGS